MKIVFLAEDQGAEAIVLGDDGAGAYIVTAPLPPGEAVVEANQMPGAAAAQHLARGNVTTTVSFSVDEYHVDVAHAGAAARAKAVLHIIDRVAALVGKKGRLSIFEGTSGQEEERQLNDAICRVVRPLLIDGVGTVMSYEFVGGVFENPN